MTVNEILSVTKGRLAAGKADLSVTGISTDSRTLASGDCFVALAGERFDGHDFLRQAAEAGASAVLVSNGAAGGKLADYAGAVVIVADTQKALGDLAAWHRRRLNCRVIAITGSCGKTSVKEMIGQLLETRRRGHRATQSFNNFVGVPLTIFGSRPRDDYLVLELGTSAPGEMRRLSEIASPDVAVVTCVGPTHLEGLGSLEGVAHEKESLVRAVGEGGVAILNGDDPLVAGMAEAARCRVVTFGVHDGDVMAQDIEAGSDWVSFQVASGVEMRLSVPGRHNVLNALAAVAVGHEFGLDDEQIARGLSGYRAPKMRLAVERLSGGLTLIDDCYNANPMSVSAALEVLCAQQAGGRHVLILGDMLELGSRSEEFHGQVGAAVAGSCVKMLITVGSETRVTSLRASERPDLMRFHFVDSPSAATEASALVEPGDVVLVKGSRGMALEYVAGALRDRFSPAGGSAAGDRK